MINHNLCFQNRSKLLKILSEILCTHIQNLSDCANASNECCTYTAIQKLPSFVAGAKPPTNTFLLLGCCCGGTERLASIWTHRNRLRDRLHISAGRASKMRYRIGSFAGRTCLPCSSCRSSQTLSATASSTNVTKPNPRGLSDTRSFITTCAQPRCRVTRLQQDLRHRERPMSTYNFCHSAVLTKVRSQVLCGQVRTSSASTK